MKNVFEKGDVKTHRFIVSNTDLATFQTGLVHPVCSTFTLSREMEWAGRLFVLEMCESNEEGVGTMLHVEHKSPALLNEEVTVNAVFKELKGNELICDINVVSGERLIALGQTGQKILNKEKINQIFTSLER